MPVIMLTMKTDRLNSWATTVAMPRPIRMDRIATSSGISPAMTAPKTSSKTTMAMGRPKSSSPCFRSLEDKVLKSWPTVCWPVTATENPPRPLAASTAMTTGLMSGSVAARRSISAACPSADTSGLVGLRSVVTFVIPDAVRTREARRYTNAVKLGSSTVAVLELTTITSVGAWPEAAPTVRA